METKKIRITTEVEIQYNPDMVSMGNIVSELDYDINVSDSHADVATITNKEIIEWH
ncbi:hypothetical protein NXX53_06685 [Bacteroides salyersiae]|nr:hypothetical protein [Bacteroides salyersiae]